MGREPLRGKVASVLCFWLGGMDGEFLFLVLCFWFFVGEEDGRGKRIGLCAGECLDLRNEGVEMD